ncbi:MAG: transposase [Candidatus Omnitrophota bacterium]
MEIDKFIIMPNHIHGIVIINNRAQASSAPTLSQIIRSFKSKTTMEYLKYIHQNKLNISGEIWQRSFYDHVIRDEESLEKVREYIFNNPKTWEMDENNIDNYSVKVQASLNPTGKFLTK